MQRYAHIARDRSESPDRSVTVPVESKAETATLNHAIEPLPICVKV